MSDLLSPVLFVTQNEVESFWCLTGFMQLLVRTDGFRVSPDSQQRAELSRAGPCRQLCSGSAFSTEPPFTY